ncbi:MAG: class I SAM-dependent methyltransferase [Anaerolineales bacterium]|nr:class I SAM-dependent methyltransferase [Anaerolineales bacterium]
MNQDFKAVLHPGREKSLLRRHPWVFSGSVQTVHGSPPAGAAIDLVDQHGVWLTRGAYSPDSRIAVRVWTWKQDEFVDERFIRSRIKSAIERRATFLQEKQTNAYREIFAESDGFPGLIVDRYGDIRVFQLLSTGPEFWKEVIADELQSGDGIAAIYERSDGDARSRDGLEPRKGLLWGRDEPLETVIHEYGASYHVDIQNGHKTGFYLDQGPNRRLLQESENPGEVLNCFAYTGGFTVAALKAGAAKVLSVESSADALDLARRNIELNNLPLDRCEWSDGDVFKELRRFRDSRMSFDTIILDPPRFAPTAAQAERASRGYKDINLLAFKLLRPGGKLMTFSCSGGISPDLFHKIVAGAALDAGVEAQITHWLAQPEDHPVSIHLPESRYIKGFIIKLAA